MDVETQSWSYLNALMVTYSQLERGDECGESNRKS